VASAAVLCPAKINLTLRVLARRTDGYHELETVFQAVGLWDRLSIGPAPTLSLRCDASGLPVDERNLALRAAILLRDRHGRSDMGGRLELRKVIPIGGGLGGGSTNAAGALVLCAAHWGHGLARADLEPLARELGADVPFFLHGGTALGRGRGDLVEPLPFAGEHDVLLGSPPFGISTAEVYGRLDAVLTGPRNGVSVPIFSAVKWREQNDFAVSNDLEDVVFEGWPELKAFRDALLEAGARAALLSGSGSTVYGVFSGPEAAMRAAGSLRAGFPTWRVAATRFVSDGVRWASAAESGGEAGAW
jgi:4-diphosphocytidyl-2-C-methyl-D-erythritol kinase